MIKKVEPRYPPIAQAARMEGNVVVDAVIRKDGSVSDVTVLRSSNRLFDQSCIDAVRQWRFTPWPPGRHSDRNGELYADSVTVNFQCNSESSVGSGALSSKTESVLRDVHHVTWAHSFGRTRITKYTAATFTAALNINSTKLPAQVNAAA